MERRTDEAIVLGAVDYGEADKLVTIFTRSRGRVSAFAAGARKSKRRFAGALEPGTHVSVLLVERRGDTERLDGADIQSSFHHLREQLPTIARALYCLELCRELVRDHEPHEALFDALLSYLGLLDAGKAGPTSLLKFELDALAEAGFMPRFDSCVLCGGPTGERPRFDPSHGGVTCEKCVLRSPGARAMTPELVAAFVGLQGGKREAWPRELRARGRELLNDFIAHQLGRRLKSVSFMEQVGTD